MAVATSEDTEITLGTGKMLLLFFALVALCAVFFAMGFSIGRNSVLKTPLADVSPSVPTTPGNTRPSAVKTANAAAVAPQALAPGKQDASESTTEGSAAPGTGNPAPIVADRTPASELTAPPVLNGYYVQVAAVSKEEDAQALVDALKRKQYPAFSANTPPDKLFHVQVGPYAEIKDAETMRTKLVNDGYNPILKK
jgi:DedD protein